MLLCIHMKRTQWCNPFWPFWGSPMEKRNNPKKIAKKNRKDFFILLQNYQNYSDTMKSPIVFMELPENFLEKRNCCPP